MVSDLCKNGLTCPTNGFEQKVHFQVFKIYVFLLFLHFFSNWFHVLRHSFYPKCETTFSKEFFFLLSLQNSKISRNMCKLCVKLRNATIYPNWGPMFKKYFFQKHTPPSSEIWNLFQRWDLKDIKEKNHKFEKSGALQITTLQKVRMCVAF